MSKFNSSEKRRALRAFIWYVLYYALLVVNVIYLSGLDEIKGVNAALIFILQLIILAISTETMSKKMSGEKISLRPWAGIDFVVKALSYVFCEMIFRFPQNVALTISMWVLFAVCMVLSLAMEIVMLIKAMRRGKQFGRWESIINRGE